MSDASKAVFLSYASQDAEAARRICDTLRAAGVEVWFDTDGGLEHGDEWDAKIRRQIKECVLFIAIVSTNTQAREEGYFRIEWELAAQRAMGIASGVAFILPVVIDDTREAAALVPDRFRSVQWTRLPGGNIPSEVKARFLKLWSHRTGVLNHQVERRPAFEPPPEPPARSRAGIYALAAAAVVAAAVGGWFMLKSPAGSVGPAGPVASSPAKLSEARQLEAQARALIDDDLMAVRENYRLADEFSRRAVALDGTDGEIWATAARVSALILGLNYEMTPERKELAKTQVERANRLAPASIETGLAQAIYLGVNGDLPQAEHLLRRLVQRAPADKRLWRQLVSTLVTDGRFDDALALFQQAAGVLDGDPRSEVLRSVVFIKVGRYREAEAVLGQVLRESPTRAAYSWQLVLLGFYRCDMPAASRFLDQIPPQLMLEDAMINLAAEIWLRLSEGDKALKVLQKSPRDFLEEGFEVRPKGYVAGHALQLAGRPTAALAEWRQALVVVEKRLAANPNQPLLLYWQALLQALTGQKAVAIETRKLYRELEAKPDPWFDAILLVALGDNEQAIRGLVECWPQAKFNQRSDIRGDLMYAPWLAAIRQDQRMQSLIAEHTAAIERDRAGPVAAASSAALPVTDAKSVAVLAFANLSDDKANEYFSDGISEELLTVLQKIPGLHVAARTSAFSFKGSNATAQEIGAKLGVATLVEGSVRKAGNTVRITARLSRAATSEQLWSESYTRDLKDVFAVQSELAQTIVGQLRGQLGGTDARAEIKAQVQAAEKGGTQNAEAHQLYLQGKYFVNRSNPSDAMKAIDLLQRAVDLDPKFALAWAALSRAGWVRGAYGNSRRDFDEGYALARRAADQAIALEPGLAAGYVARLDIQSSTDFDWQGSKETMRRLQELAPNDPAVILQAAQLAYGFGRKAEGIELIRRAVTLDPVNPELYLNVGFMLLAARRFAEAETAFRQLLDIRSDSPWGYAGLAMVMVARGDFDQAAITVQQQNPGWSRLYIQSLAQWGQKKRDEADASLAQLVKEYADVAAYQIACAYAFRGDADCAFEWLERAYQQKDPGLSWAKPDFFLGPLNADARWGVLMRKLGLADDQLK